MTSVRPLRARARLVVALLATSVLVLVNSGVWAAPLPQADAVLVDIQRQVGQVRGLDVLSETPLAVLPRATLIERLGSELNTDKSVREFLTSQMLLEVLGVTSDGYDLRQLQLRLLEEQTLAVYDFQDDTIYAAAESFQSGDVDVDGRLVLAHELTHALQDQHFDLQRVLPAVPENSDVAMAGRALVEGDAMLTMRIWGRQYLRPADKRNLGNDTTPTDPVLDDAPPLVQGESLFPYDAGWVFAQLLYQDGGYEAINQAFARPPRSTEQILHPEKYQAGESPVAVALAPLEQGLSGTWKTLRTDVFGELVLRLFLEPNVGWPVAEGAAAGWGGDAYTILEDAEGHRIVALMTVWDTESDAAEMFNAFAESIPAQYAADQRRTLTQPGVGRWTIPGYQVQALTTGKTVRMVYAPDVATLEQVDALISAARIGPSGPVAPPPTSPPAPIVTVAPESGRLTPTPQPDEDGDATVEPAFVPAGFVTPGPVATGTPGPATDSTPMPEATQLPPAGGGEGRATPTAAPTSSDDEDAED
jgi:hypothetical protein